MDLLPSAEGGVEEFASPTAKGRAEAANGTEREGEDSDSIR